MGILDDAIRAHLDLKREHGAPDDEISRQEREALGPARRGAPAEEEGSADDVAAEAAPEAAGARARGPGARARGRRGARCTRRGR